MKVHWPYLFADGGLTPLIESINASSSSIVGMIPFWHNYRYDGGAGRMSMIRDGGGDMYDGGNKVKRYPIAKCYFKAVFLHIP